MRLSDVTKFVSGSIIVYVVMAACAAGAADDSTEVARDAGKGGGGATSGDGDPADDDAAGGDLDATGGDQPDSPGGSVLDAIINPVKDAKADDAPVSGSRLKVKYYAGEDGSKLPIPGSMFDTQLGIDCQFGTMFDGVLRCIPAIQVTNILYSDAACTAEMALVPKCSTNQKYVVRPTTSTTTNACVSPWPYDYFTLGSAMGATVTYSKSGTTCSGPTDVSANYNAFHLGAQASLSTFASATIQTAP